MTECAFFLSLKYKWSFPLIKHKQSNPFKYKYYLRLKHYSFKESKTYTGVSLELPPGSDSFPLIFKPT